MQVYVSLGSNLPDGEHLLLEALEWLKGLATTLSASGIYTTRPVSGSGSDYFNAVACLETECDLASLHRLTKEYECEHGRTPEAKQQGRVPIDLDIVVADGAVLRPADFRQPYFRIGYQSLTSLAST